MAAAGAATVELELVGVNKTYWARLGKVQDLSDINLSINRGEFVSLVGRSGCGKTTLLRILSGLLAPTSGVVQTNGTGIWKGSKRDDELTKAPHTRSDTATLAGDATAIDR